MKIDEVKDIKKISVSSTDRREPRFSATSFLFIIFGCSIVFIGYQVFQISQKVSNIKISDEKMDYVYGKVGDLVNVLNTKETSDINYNPTEKYDFKPAENEIVAEQPAAVQANNEVLKEEISKMEDGDKLKVVRDKLIDIYQKSKERDEELSRLKQSFYETKSLVENWYNDKKNIKKNILKNNSGDNAGLMNKLKENLSNFIQVSKVSENLSNGSKKILNVDQIPEMLSYAEILMEAGSFSQVSWIMEDIQSMTKQEEILAFTAKTMIFIDKYPNPNTDVKKIKDLIELIETDQNLN